MSNMAALVAGRPHTRADLEQTPDDGRRYELIDGVMVVSAAPGHLHQRAAARLLVLLDAVAPAEVWELGEDGSYRQVAKAVGDEQAVLAQPHLVTIVPSDLVR